MLIIKLGRREHRPADANDPFLPRTLIGWDATMTPEQVRDAAQGWWRVGDRAEQEQFALVVAPGDVGSVMGIEIEEWTRRADGRRAFRGSILAADHPVAKAYLGRPDPSGSTSRQPARYWEAPDLPDQYTPCLCGCKIHTRRDFVQGHDLRALYALAEKYFSGVPAMLDWFAKNGKTALQAYP
ncbi:MAG: hypothetical protein M3083_02835 [Actinomycetota bacterium]|nr:hypothetical protein [Actinomycetota bacterium]